MAIFSINCFRFVISFGSWNFLDFSIIYQEEKCRLTLLAPIWGRLTRFRVKSKAFLLCQDLKLRQPPSDGKNVIPQPPRTHCFGIELNCLINSTFFVQCFRVLFFKVLLSHYRFDQSEHDISCFQVPMFFMVNKPLSEFSRE